ncbi:endo-arabinase [Flavobacterium sp.]|uniref:endo-arabinase n=1 Tax=Flavobacterium sp. TaxID=239 RepID=UPI003751D6E9
MKNFKIIFFLFLCFAAVSCSSYKNESIAIKQLLEKESATWRSGDAIEHANCWKIEPYSRILVSTVDGKSFDVPPLAMVQTNPQNMGNGGSSINTNYKIKISGRNAWVSHDEVSTDKDGTKTYSYEIRILEKSHNQWKLVSQSIHAYIPN